jgi:hypothetical protein
VEKIREGYNERKGENGGGRKMVVYSLHPKSSVTMSI